MSYQVLARKWRPRSFESMVGQEHVLRALTNALDNDRLHHAFLFTGTRGVGKTTVARILAKALNCERGVSAHPCGECASCREIDEGRFVDLIEVDAASRTKVEDTRELLENVQYAPTRGRYKVYLIDEVHMLSGHSFNALLKTLEEPPPHVKFLLATTDPQKLPVTILSRCLQFNLKHLRPELIRGYLDKLIESEGLSAEPAAVAEIARAADGSMRDALSLLDQAIAYGGGELKTAEVLEMLGTVDRSRVTALVGALADGDAAALMGHCAQLAEMNPDYDDALQRIASLLQRIALAQVVPAAVQGDGEEGSAALELAGRMSPEDVQLYYQIAIIGRRDLPLAPDPRGGFEMVLLRMLSFRPEVGDVRPAGPGGGEKKKPDELNRPAVRPAEGATLRVVRDNRSPAPALRAESDSDPQPVPPQAVAEPKPAPVMRAVAAPGAVAESAPDPLSRQWAQTVAALPISGMNRQLLMQAHLLADEGTRISLGIAPELQHLFNAQRVTTLETAFREHRGAAVRLDLRVEQGDGVTPEQVRQHDKAERQRQAEADIADDDVLNALLERFEGEVRPNSIRPLD